MQEYSLYVCISSFIISICILPILLYLLNNKLKFKPKAIYNIYFVICIVLFIPLISIKFNKIEGVKNIQYNELNNMENISNSEELEETSRLGVHESSETKALNVEKLKTEELKTEELKIIKAKIENEKNENSINIKNDFIYWLYAWFPKIWLIISISILLYYYVIYKIYIIKLDVIEEKNIMIENIINTQKHNMKITKNIKYAFSNKINTPITIGIINKKIIIPKNFEILDYKYIMKHELFHLKNKDVEFKFMCVLLESIYFFNPIIKLLTKQINEIIELNCDYNILEKENDLYRKEYGNILLKQIENNGNRQYKLVTNFASSRRNIMDRFKNILNEKSRKKSITITCVFISFIIISVIAMIFIPNINIAATDNKIMQNDAHVEMFHIAEGNIVQTNEKSDNEKITSELVQNNKVEDNVNIVKQVQENNVIVNENDNDKKILANSVQNNKIEEKENTIKVIEGNIVKTNEKDNNDKIESEKVVNTVIDKTNNKEENTKEDKNIENNETYVEKVKNTEKTLENNNSVNTQKKVFPLNSTYRITTNFKEELQFSEGKIHNGIDYATKEGEKIFAVMSGKVISVGYKFDCGNFIILDHGNGIRTIYNHCSNVLKKQGEDVNAGDVIAKVGSTGMSTGPHLHFEVQKNGVPVNPITYLP